MTVGAAGSLLAGSARAGSVAHFAGHAGRFGVLHDTTLCVGCRSCEVACAQVNGHPPPAAPVGDQRVFENRRRTTPQAYTVVNRYRTADGRQPAVFRKHQCMHCNEPCCAAVCLVRAFSKTAEGPILYDPDVCIGCRYCVMACPYYALAYDYDDPVTPQVQRCTLCYSRIKQGQHPGCSDACPTGSLQFGRREDLLKVARARIRKRPERYLDHVFGEHEFGGTSWLMLAGLPFRQLDLHEGVTHTSLPEIGTAFLNVVPLVITIYPGLLAGFYAFSKRKEKLSQQAAQAAVVEALMKADEQTKQKLAAAAKKATKDKEKAIAKAVKQALADAKKKAEAAQSKEQEK
jgi:Fe-S-cluster-containing dehydrogenase component